MKNIDQSRIFDLTDYKRQDFSVCLGCKICASVCTVNDLSESTNPQEILQKLFLGKNIPSDDHLVRYCTGCYRCTGACPWNIRIPEVIRALREELATRSPFEKAFKDSVSIWGRVYEPYVIIMAIPFLLKGGYIKHMTRWTEYMGIHLPHKVKRA
ncbi:MAG: 4Fe-4S dicluster domain-containing protein [Proteobacteria bacterium]|nr:4Fe-4S dicluster domain-containing protein [Pseudomonadota bacterium]